MKIAAHAAGESSGLLSLVVSFAMEVLEEQSSLSVHTAGLTNLLSHPEYQSLDRAQPLLSYLSREEDLSRLPLPQHSRTNILIGPENVTAALKDTSVVMASYDIGEGMRGVIGVVGPTRMDYAKITARLSYFADGLARLFGQGELSSGDKEEHSHE
jgi:heat-inducible transcriptional repressor